ncbi:hypothetical protein GCM10010401_07120 [Rarobacter faecitabidus]|uniref:Uncharacterized protein n=1 Tax=Rarobacter faecitabidus TaxID=13243 RepID=A0A542Z856_RARFA|nr:hypothetical protein FB461_2403 [Rarobacter faecitabidus]
MFEHMLTILPPSSPLYAQFRGNANRRPIVVKSRSRDVWYAARHPRAKPSFTEHESWADALKAAHTEAVRPRVTEAPC